MGGICAPPAFISPVPELMGGEGVHRGPGLRLDLGVGPQLARSLGQLGLLSLSAVVQSLDGWGDLGGRNRTFKRRKLGRYVGSERNVND